MSIAIAYLRLYVVVLKFWSTIAVVSKCWSKTIIVLKCLSTIKTIFFRHRCLNIIILLHFITVTYFNIRLQECLIWITYLNTTLRLWAHWSRPHIKNRNPIRTKKYKSPILQNLSIDTKYNDTNFPMKL